MTFERDIVNCFNRYFSAHHVAGFAYRLKQGRFFTQFVDVVVDSPDPSFYLAIECKSTKENRLNFKSNFHTDKNNRHQIENITEFLRDTGRKGYLAVEFRRKNGNEAYLFSWWILGMMWCEGVKSLDAITCRMKGIPLERVDGGYRVEKW